MNPKILHRFLSNTSCYHCGALLEGAEVTFLFRSAMAGIVHLRCQECGSETLATLSVNGHSVTNIQTDLTKQELKEFFGSAQVSADDVLDLHQLISEDNLWLALKQKEEKQQEKKSKNSAARGSYQQSSWNEEELLSPLS